MSISVRTYSVSRSSWSLWYQRSVGCGWPRTVNSMQVWCRRSGSSSFTIVGGTGHTHTHTHTHTHQHTHTHHNTTHTHAHTHQHTQTDDTTHSLSLSHTYSDLHTHLE